MPVDSPIFDEVSDPQWLWYFHNFVKDNEDRFDFQRNLIEYHAGFLAPDAVMRVRKRREGKDKPIVVSNEQFNKNLSDMFGRDLQGNVANINKATVDDYNFWNDVFIKE